MSKIKDGYILLARKTFESKIINKPPLYFKLWVWMLVEAKFKTTNKHQKGTFKTSIKKMQNAMTYYVGARQEKPSKRQIRTIYKYFAKVTMIVFAKVTDGLAISILNYKEYQNPKNYESHSESHSESHTRGKTVKTPQNIPQRDTYGCQPESHTLKQPKQPQNNALDAEDITRKSQAVTHLNNRKNDRYNSKYSISNIYNTYNKNYPCEKLESDFDRDRRIFFIAFPGVKTFQTFDDDADRKNKKLITISHSKPDCVQAKLILSLEKGNELGAGIYICVNETNGKGRKATDVVRVRAVFGDFDNCPIEPVWKFDPSMVVESSPGKYHAYWLTVPEDNYNVPLEGFTDLQESIASKFKSDPVVKDLSRVMRVPGFNHMKKEPFMTRIIHYTGQTHDFGYLISLFPPVPREQWSASKYQKPVNGNNGEFKGTRGVAEPGRNCHIIKCLGGAKKRGLSWPEIEQEAYLEGAACSPQVKESEIRLILKSFRRY